MVRQIERTSLEDVRKQALPLGTHVVAGNALMGRAVTWVSVIYPEYTTATRLPYPGEMLLVASQPRNHNVATSEIEALRHAASIQASAIVFCDPPSPAAMAEANNRRIPLLVLPENSSVRMVEQAIVRLLIDHKGQLEQRGAQVYRQLAGISSSNGGLQKMIYAMAQLTDKTVILQDKNLGVLNSTVQPQLHDAWEEIEQFLARQDNVPTEFQDRYRIADMDPAVLMQAIPRPGLARLISPVIAGEIGRGYLSVIGPDTELDDIDALVTEHGAAACALEMAKAKAVSDTEKRLRGTFLDRLLSGDVSQQEAIGQGVRFNHDMSVPHTALALNWLGEQTPSPRRLETLVRWVVSRNRIKALVWHREREQEVLVFFAPDGKNPVDSGLALAQSCRDQARRQYGGSRIAAGLGQMVREVSSWRNSYRDARQALELAQRLQTDIPLYIGDLGVFQLILSLSDRDRLVEFCDRNLGPLRDYDHRQHADLVKTLEAFFHCNRNLSQTAETLIVHRNTLLYRMNRIQEIAGIDMKRPETRLALHFALTIRRLLSLS
ncbi:MAG: helix-turn-helix domain-containing protein [Anaerolineae bacterium]|nr:helix-turn-helix domain-containing protein [Anaerolineae bacterium]